MPNVSIVLGTHNQKKLREMQSLLQNSPIKLKTLADFNDPLEVEESGATFAENAALKATQQSRHLDHWVLGEDSGLTVDAIGGQPGVFSSRFAGDNASDDANNEKLIRLLADIPVEKRTAFYTCHMSLSDPSGVVQIDLEHYCRGRIVLEGRGNAGFGYDPFFEIPEYHLTFGELGDAVKGVLSHRGKAMRALVRQLNCRASLPAPA